MHTTRRRNLQLESLEPRLPLAGLVTAVLVDDDLIITGDAAYNEFDIVPVTDGDSVTLGAFEIQGLNGTSINVAGQTSDRIPGANGDIIISIPRGGYDVELKGAEGQLLQPQGDVRAHLWAAPNGDASQFDVTYTKVLGDLFVKTFQGVNYGDFDESEFHGNVAFEAGRGHELFFMRDSELHGNLDVTGVRGAGADPKMSADWDGFHLSDSVLRGDMTVKGIPGGSTGAGVSDTQVIGDFIFEGGSGRESAWVNFSEVNEVIMDTGGNSDQLRFFEATVDKVFAEMGSESDLVQLQGSTVHTSVTLSTAQGPDVVGMLDLTVGEKFYLNTAQGRDVVFLGTNQRNVPRNIWPDPIRNWQAVAGSKGLVAQSATIFTGGGNDWFELQNSAIALDTQVFTGGGNDRLRLVRTEVGGKVRLQTGAGSDAIDVLRCQVAGQTLVLAGGGNDKLRAIGNELSRNLAVNMGAGRDVLTAKFNKVSGKARLFGDGGFDTLAQKKNLFGGLKVVVDFEKIA